MEELEEEGLTDVFKPWIRLALIVGIGPAFTFSCSSG